MNKDNIPKGMGFKTFDTTHLLWLLSIAAACIGVSALYGRLSDRNRRIMRTVLGGLILFLEILKDAVLILRGEFSAGYLPFHLCGINVLLVGFDLIKQNNTVRNFLYYFSIAGASLALIFPNWTQLPCLNFSHIHSFIIHGLLIMYPLLLVTSGEVKPDLKTMPKCILLLVLMAIPIYYINIVCDTNFMFLMHPDSGNPLELFEKLFGSHLWGFPILLPIVMFIMYLPIFIITKAKNKKA